VVPMVMASPDIITHDSTLTADGAPLWLLAVLQSAMWLAWVRTVGGRLKSDLRITPDIAYNAFPFPDLDEDAKIKLAGAAQAMLDARALYPGSSLADLYDPMAMPPELVSAHDNLDDLVESLYEPAVRFTSDSERLRALFIRYEKLRSAGA
jgi:hypothetical protein